MEAVFSTMGHQAMAHVASMEFEDNTQISRTVSSITAALKKGFPGLQFRCEYRGDGGVDFLINDINAFLSPEFGAFLDRIAAPLTMDQYMLIDFIPSEPSKPLIGYAGTTSISSSSMGSFLPESTNKENGKASIIPGKLLGCVYLATVPESYSKAA